MAVTDTYTDVLAEALRFAVRLLTTVWEPSTAFALFGIKLALLLVPVLIVLPVSLHSLFGVDRDRPWDRRDTIRVIGAVVGMFYYLSNFDSAYWVIGRVLTPADTGVIARAAQISMDGSGLVLSILLFGLLGPVILLLGLIGILRAILVVAVFPTVAPILTLLWVCRIPGLSPGCGHLLRRLRWVIVSGIAATAVITIGMNGTSLLISSRLAEFSGSLVLLCVLGTLVASVTAMVQMIRYGPRLDDEIDKLLGDTFPGAEEGTGPAAESRYTDTEQ